MSADIDRINKSVAEWVALVQPGVDAHNQAMEKLSKGDTND